MKRNSRIFAVLFSAMMVLSAGAVSVQAAECQNITLPVSSCGKTFVVTANDCNSLNNCNIQEIIQNCSNGNCKIEEIIQNCGLLPDNNQCTDCDTNTAEEIPATPVISETPQQTQPSESTVNTLSDYENQVIQLVNQYRNQNGLASLQANAELSKIARIKSQDMKDKHYFDHTSPTYGSPFDMMKQFGIQYRTAGENIAMGQKTPEAVMNAWMNSEGHRANILNSSFTQIGVGYIADGNYWTQMFIS